MSRDYRACPHPPETWHKEDALYSYRCPDCRARPCLDCRRYGDRGFMIPLVSWMTGTCDDCYRTRERRAKIRAEFYRDRDQRVEKARVWEDGKDAEPDAPNPFAEPGHWETSALEQHEWLRDEVTR